MTNLVDTWRTLRKGSRFATMPHEHLPEVLQGQLAIMEIEEILGDFDGAAARDFLDG